MYGRIFSSMFTGSMVGKGSPVFALMSYVIAHMRGDKEVGAQVDLNIPLLAFTIGEKPEVIQSAIDYLCSPDHNTTTPGEEGRRLVKVGTFAYRVVNGAKYLAIRNQEEQREASRIRVAAFRERQKEAEQHPKKTPGQVEKHGFKKPTLFDAKACMMEKGLAAAEAGEQAERFVNYYESNGWKVGRNPMKCWPSAVSNWLKNYRERNGEKRAEPKQLEERITIKSL